MNETDFIRRQLAAERAHLREVLEAAQRTASADGPAQAVATYINWAGSRVLQELTAHLNALQALGNDAASPPLSRIAAALGAAGARARAPVHAQRLLALLEAWTEPLERLAGATLRLDHWRQAAQLSADSILEERQRYAAARAAAGLS